MNKAEREIIIPKFLWKLHGKRARLLEIALTYLLGLIVGIYTCYAVDNGLFPDWKMLLLFLLAVDIGGGIISNFTKSTEDYYIETKGSTHFIGLHLLQGGILCLIFPDSLQAIGIIVIGILIGASAVSRINNQHYQKVIGVFLWVILIIVLDILKIQPSSLYLLLNLLGFKLIVAFAIKWH